jgi:hypothetical protein
LHSLAYSPISHLYFYHHISFTVSDFLASLLPGLCDYVEFTKIVQGNPSSREP